MVEWAVNIISHPLLPGVSAMLIIMWGLVSWLSFRSKAARLHRSLDEAIKLLDFSLGVDDFSKSFKQIDHDLISIGDMNGPWSRFRDTLNSTSGKPIQGTQTPALFLNFESIVLPQINYQHYRSMPGYLIGCGLLFTFAGFSSAFYFAYHGLSSPDLDTVRGALNGLLNTASVKFSASISGLLSGLLYSWMEKSHARTLERKISNLCQLLSDQVEWVHDGAKEGSSVDFLLPNLSNELLERISTGLDESVGELETKIVQVINQTINPLAEEIRRDGEKRDRRQEGLVQGVVQGAGREIRQVLDEESEPFRRAASHMDRSLTILDDKISAMARVSLDPVIDIVKSEGSHLLEQLRKQSFMDSVVETVKAEGLRQTTSNERMIRESMADINQRLKFQGLLDPVIETVKNEIERLTELLRSNNFMEPVLEQVISDSNRQGAVSERVVRELFGEMNQKLRHPAFVEPMTEAVKREINRIEERLQGDLLIEPLIIAIKSESSRQGTEIEGTIREKLGEVSQRLRNQGFLEPIVDSVKQEIRRVTEELRSKFDLDPIIDTVKAEVAHQGVTQEKLIRELLGEVSNTLRAQGFVEPVVASVKAEIERMVSNQLPQPDILQPILELVKQEGVRISSDLQQVVDTVNENMTKESQKGGDKLDEILATVRSEISQLSQSGTNAIRESVEKLMAKPMDSISPEQILFPLQEALNDSTRQIKEGLSLESVIDAIKGEGSKFDPNQLSVIFSQELESLTAHFNKTISSAVKELTDHLSQDDHSAPIIAAVEAEGKKLARIFDGEQIFVPIKDEIQKIVSTLEEEGQKFAEGRDAAVIEAVSQVADKFDGVNSDEILDSIKNVVDTVNENMTKESQKGGDKLDEILAT
ncbi:MAG: hypothetical protein HQL68_11365, partial [Magnetococcales bacterium]|nr:hypothetical protein [Magnetococcales bacterium]